MVGGQTGALGAPSVMRLVLGRDGQSYIRRAHVAVISVAFGIIAIKLLELQPDGASTRGLVGFWALPAIAVVAVIAATLVIASGSSSSLAVLGRFGIPEISPRRRARANGLVWAGIGLLMVHFTAPAFEFVPGGPIVMALVFGLGLGVGTMRLHLAAIDHEAYRSFNLVAMLLAAGSLASMSITPTGDWWAHNFSTLGTSDDIAAACFNIAVTMSGLGMALLGPALSGALRAERFGLRRGGLTAIRILIAFIGVSLMGVGLVPIDGATDLHNLFACGAAAGFAVLALGVQLWARRMPRALVAFSYAALGVEVAAMVAYDGLKVFNLTVFEIVAFALVFAWLIALVAITSAADVTSKSLALEAIALEVVALEADDLVRLELVGAAVGGSEPEGAAGAGDGHMVRHRVPRRGRPAVAAVRPPARHPLRRRARTSSTLGALRGGSTTAAGSPEPPDPAARDAIGRSTTPVLERGRRIVES